MNLQKNSKIMAEKPDTVGELIEALEQFDRDKPVRVIDDGQMLRPYVAEGDDYVTL